MARQALRRRRGRSLLTMLGVIIGVASVLIVVSIGGGAKQQIAEDTNLLGKDLITIRSGKVSTDSSALTFANLGLLAGNSGALGYRDLTTVKKTSGVGQVAPLSLVASDVVSGDGGKHYAASVIGTTGDFRTIMRQGMAYGAFLDDQDEATYKVVLGQNVARELYDEDAPLGHTLSLLGHDFVVSGVVKSFQITPLSPGGDLNNAVFISYVVSEQLTNDTAPIYQILVRPQRAEDTDTLASSLQRRLYEAHGGQHDVTVMKQAQTLAVASSILNLLTAMVTGLAAIALLVGGVGIMNVMLVSVTERMHEIGIRKAVGATNGQILAHFVIEAAVLSFGGAIIGVVVAMMVDVVLRVFTNFTPVMDWQIAAVACVVSMGVGVLFGSIPALHAARKDPIAALRNE